MKRIDLKLGLLPIFAAILMAAPIAKAATDNQDATSEATQPTVNGITAPTFGPYRMSVGLHNWNTAARAYEADAGNSARYRLRNEYYMGLTHTTGWGLSAMAVTSGVQTMDTSRNSKTGFGAGDPSLTVTHPALFDNGILKTTGQFREYFPVSQFSQDNQTYQQAYYLFTTYKAPYNVDVFNQLTPRHFQQPKYADSDTTWYVEDYGSVTKKVNSWFKYGMAHHEQVEWHNRTSNGTSIEVAPMTDFVINSNFFIEPRVWMPVYEVNSVYLAPKNTTLSNAQAEIYMQLSI